MATGPSTTADDLADNIRAMVNRMVDAEFTKQLARRGREVAAVLAERAQDMGEAAADAWDESAPTRRDAAKRMNRASRDAAKWSERTWRRSVRPAVRDLWKRRTLAIGAAGAAVPVGRDLLETAAQRMRVQRREERHWGAFFLGLIIGAIGGAIVALLTAPKPGSEFRRELGERADEVREELAARARTEWVPLFEREPAPIESVGMSGPAAASAAERTAGPIEEAAATAGANGSEAIAEPATETYDTVDATPVAADTYAPADAAEPEGGESSEGIDRETP
jgi:gas vesicle protein